MQAKHTKLIIIVSLFVGIPFLFGCLSLKQIVEVAGDNQEQLPIRSLTITIDPDHREELFDQFRKFAHKHDFEFMITDYGTGGERFLVEMLGNHIKILAVDISKAPTMIAINFYDQTRVTPVREETIKTIDNLASVLKTFISEIPNVTIVEQ